MRKILLAAAAAGASLLQGPAASSVAVAAEIRFLHPGVLTGFVRVVVPQFENATGHKVTTAAGTGGALTNRIQQGEAADVLIVTAEQVAQLVAQGKIVSGTQVGIAGVGMGIGVRKGTPKPDISSVDALKRALLAATSIGYPDPALGAPSGAYAAKLIADLGIAGELKAKIKLYGSGPESVAGLAKGEVELGFSQMTDLVGNPDIVLAGSLPGPVQNTTRLAAGIVASSQQQDAAKALLNFLTSPTARSALSARGFE